MRHGVCVGVKEPATERRQVWHTQYPRVRPGSSKRTRSPREEENRNVFAKVEVRHNQGPLKKVFGGTSLWGVGPVGNP